MRKVTGNNLSWRGEHERTACRSREPRDTHLDVAKALFLTGRIDVDLLRSRIGQHLDAGLGVFLGQVQPQAPPSASEVENAETFPLPGSLFAQTGLVTIALEHDLLRLSQRLLGELDVFGSARSSRVLERWIVARGIFHAGSQT